MEPVAALEAHDLYRFYHVGDEETLALKGFSLRLLPGEVVAITGRSGSGKSTLLNCLAGLDEPDGGWVAVAGERLARGSEAARARLRGRSIGVLLQGGNLMDHLTVAQNVQIAASLAGTGNRPDIRRALSVVGIESRADALPSHLSGGELARAGLAVALINNPAILLADEPTGEVDAENEEKLLALFQQRASDGGATLIGASAQEVMNLLAEHPDGVLVSAATVSDFQMQPGDQVKSRLQSATDQQYHAVPFHYVGIAREFPTAPSDSFLVANADYIAQWTGSASVETLLIKTSGDPAIVAESVRGVLEPTSGAVVQDIQAERALINSSLTSISLRGLTRIELTFAVLLAATGAGLVLLLGLEERRRTLAIATALGATPRQIGAFVWSEAGLILFGGLAAGLALGWGVSHMLIKLLTHVFDPPPQQATIPWDYLLLVTIAVFATISASAALTSRNARLNVIETIRRL